MASTIPFLLLPSALPLRSPRSTRAAAAPPTTVSSSPLSASSPRKKVLVPVAMGTEEMEAVILAGVLRLAGADVVVASVSEGFEVVGSSGTRLVADALIADCAHESFDLVALPGGMPGSVHLRDCQILRSLTTRHAEQSKSYGAICAAPAVVLVPWGLHKRKQITCHPAFMDKLPTFRAVKSNVQVSGQLTTSRGPGTSLEFALSFVEQLLGSSKASDVDRMLMTQSSGSVQRTKELNKVEWSYNHTPHVLIPVANGSEEMEIIMLADILRRAKANVVVASVEKSPLIVGSQKIKIISDCCISDTSTSSFDLIIVPGGPPGIVRLQKSAILKKLLKEQKSAGRAYGGMCLSPTILQKHGLLKDKMATAHPSILDEITGQVDGDAGVVIDGNAITGKGLGNVIDLSLAIVAKLFGKGRARSVAEGIVYDYAKN